MNTGCHVDWGMIRQRAARFPEGAFQFVREGLSYTVKRVHGVDSADLVEEDESRPRHVDGRQLSAGLRDWAIKQYGPLAGTVLRKWGLRGTEDFGVIVYAMIDRGEMRQSPEDRFDDFKSVYDFAGTFVEPAAVTGVR